MAFDDYPIDMEDIKDFDKAVSFTGPCGDTIEFFLKLEGEVIQRIAFRVKGCINTFKCGEAACKLAEGSSLEDAKRITAWDIAKEAGIKDEGSFHCAELAETALKMALMD